VRLQLACGIVAAHHHLAILRALYYNQSMKTPSIVVLLVVKKKAVKQIFKFRGCRYFQNVENESHSYYR
jgi:hypothetical protein